MPITRAVIPAGGRGTRMRPASLAYPKELIALGAEPALDFVLDEAVSAGIREVCIVVGPDKGAIRRYVDRRREEGGYPDVSFSWALQEVPLGLADAVSRARDFAAGEVFALLLPDNILLSPHYRLSALLDAQLQHGGHIVAVLELDSSWTGLYGNCGLFAGELLATGLWRIDRLLAKGRGTLAIEPGRVARRTCGRYVCHPDLFDAIERHRALPRDGELDEVPIYDEIARRNDLVGVPVPLPLFDVGQPAGCLAAAAFLASQRRVVSPPP
jgi:UTP--glucose-1-phosphate uridylyltransferase